MLRGKKLIVHRLRACDGQIAPGELRVEEGQLRVGCAGGTVELVEVQMEGKKRMEAGDFLRGFQVKSGEKLG